MNHPNGPILPAAARLRSAKVASIVPTTQGTLPGWEGGFAQSDPAFAYPEPDLSSLTLSGNDRYVNQIQRQMGVRWPEFSWLRDLGDEDSRCFQMFAPYISRIGYTNEGQSHAIICPQQGVWIGSEFCLNVEVTVTSQRGWVDETADNSKEDEGTVAADLTVTPHIWLTLNPSTSEKWKNIWHELSHWGGFPTTKETAIKLQTSSPADPSQAWFRLRKGMSTRYTSPDFTQHEADGAFTVANLGVKIGEPVRSNYWWVRDFNALVMKAFNLASGNMLAPTSVLTWNVWFAAPNYVCVREWEAHAARWRLSIEAHHGSPDGPSSEVRDRHGNPVTFESDALKDVERELVGLVNHVVHGYPSP